MYTLLMNGSYPLAFLSIHLPHEALLERLRVRHVGKFEPNKSRVLEEKLKVSLRERSKHALVACE